MQQPYVKLPEAVSRLLSQGGSAGGGRECVAVTVDLVSYPFVLHEISVLACEGSHP